MVVGAIEVKEFHDSEKCVIRVCRSWWWATQGEPVEAGGSDLGVWMDLWRQVMIVGK